MPRRKRTGGVTEEKSRKLNGWVTGKNLPGPIRRRLRSATLFDRFLIALVFFIAGAFGTGALYFYLSSNTGRRRFTPLPLQTLTGLDARTHFLVVCLLGGIVGVAIYLYLTITDPYGTTSADESGEEETAKARKDRFAFIQEREQREQEERQRSTSTDDQPSGQ